MFNEIIEYRMIVFMFEISSKMKKYENFLVKTKILNIKINVVQQIIAITKSPSTIHTPHICLLKPVNTHN